MPICRRCNGYGSVETWLRSQRNGRLTKLCPRCYARAQTMHAENAAARAAGYIDRTHTPEYKRMQRERDAEKQGRALCEYVPQAKKEERAALARAEKEAHAPLLWAEKEADRIRRRFIAARFREFRRLATVSPEDADAHAAYQRRRYARHRQHEVARTAAWKVANPDRISEYGRTRYGREIAGADGTATREAVAQLKRRATNCAYCGGVLTSKETDHMIAVGLEGAHSLRNIVIVCPTCNGRKAMLPYETWIERVAPEHWARVVALYVERYGDLTIAA